MRTKFLVLACLSVVLLALTHRVAGLGRGSTIDQSPVAAVPLMNGEPLPRPMGLVGSLRKEGGAVSASTSGAPAHSAASGSTAGHRPNLLLSVDGEKNPESIPDDLAYRHFVSATAIRSVASQAEIERRDGLVARLDLSAGDTTTYLLAVGGVREELEEIDGQRQRVVQDDISNGKTLSELNSQRERVLDAAAERLRSTLSKEGAEHLRSHVTDHVKRRIKIYTDAR